jgi:hypothetical protein
VEREGGKPSVKNEEVLDGYLRKMKEIYIAREASQRYINDRHFDSRTPTECVISRTARSAPVIHTVKQSLQIPRTERNET